MTNPTTRRMRRTRSRWRSCRTRTNRCWTRRCSNHWMMNPRKMNLRKTRTSRCLNHCSPRIPRMMRKSLHSNCSMKNPTMKNPMMRNSPMIRSNCSRSLPNSPTIRFRCWRNRCRNFPRRTNRCCWRISPSWTKTILRWKRTAPHSETMIPHWKKTTNLPGSPSLRRRQSFPNSRTARKNGLGRCGSLPAYPEKGRFLGRWKARRASAFAGVV
jgi:hypothetical protein